MDPLTHGLVGAAASQTFSDKGKMRPAAFTGFAAAMAADLDYFIHLSSDPLFNLEVHRQFTHSLIFIPAGALIASAVLYWLVRRHLSFKETYLYSLAGYATAGLMDAFTSYGTQLLWPFSDARIAWNLLSVADPLLTAGLMIFVGTAIFKTKKVLVFVSWAWLFLFLMFGLIQKERSQQVFEELSAMRGHKPVQMVVKPTIGNQLLWRGNYIFEGKIYSAGLRAGILKGMKIYEGDSAALVILEEEFGNYQGTTLYSDMKRFGRLSEGYLVRHPQKPGIIGDARYAMLPTSVSPLWGVEADTTNPSQHLPFLYFRDASKEIRSEFMNMLLGK